jgi:hypothetical protein
MMQNFMSDIGQIEEAGQVEQTDPLIEAQDEGDLRIDSRPPPRIQVGKEDRSMSEFHRGFK